MIGLSELARRFNYHTVEADVAEIMAKFRAEALTLAQKVDDHLPDGPEKGHAIAALDDALKHIISGLARPAVGDVAATAAATGCCSGQSAATGSAQPVTVTTGTPCPGTADTGSATPAPAAAAETGTDAGSTETGTAETASPAPAPAAATDEQAAVTGTGA